MITQFVSGLLEKKNKIKFNELKELKLNYNTQQTYTEKKTKLKPKYIIHCVIKAKQNQQQYYK